MAESGSTAAHTGCGRQQRVRRFILRGCTRSCRGFDVGWVEAANPGGEAHRIGLVEGVGGPRAAMRRSDPPYERLLLHALRALGLVPAPRGTRADVGSHLPAAPPIAGEPGG